MIDMFILAQPLTFSPSYLILCNQKLLKETFLPLPCLKTLFIWLCYSAYKGSTFFLRTKMKGEREGEINPLQKCVR